MPERWLALLGHPVGHSLSPAMQMAALRAAGLDWTYELLDVPPAALPERLGALRDDPRWAGCNLTIPHKEAVLPLLDEVDEEARLIGAVNTVVRTGDRLAGFNTDAVGFLRDLEEHGVDAAALRGAQVLVLGAGGAARAVAFALAGRGARLVIANRTASRAAALARHLDECFGQGRAEAVPLEDPALPARFAAFDLVVNCTSAGMSPDEHLDPLPPGCRPRAGQVFYDLVYRPPVTAFLRRAADAGARTIGGLGMLLHQGAAAFELWTGRQAPLAVMREALARALLAEKAGAGERAGGSAAGKAMRIAGKGRDAGAGPDQDAGGVAGAPPR